MIKTILIIAIVIVLYHILYSTVVHKKRFMGVLKVDAYDPENVKFRISFERDPLIMTNKSYILFRIEHTNLRDDNNR